MKRFSLFSLLSRSLLPILLFACLAAGCQRRIYVPVESARISSDSVRAAARLADFRFDSVYRHDRDSIVIRIVGDTVFRDRVSSSDRIVYRDHSVEIHDTMYVVHRDSVRIPAPYPVEKIVEVPRARPWYETALIVVGALALAAGGVWIYFRSTK